MSGSLEKAIERVRASLPDELEIVGGVAMRQKVVGCPSGKMCMTESKTRKGLEIVVIQDSDNMCVERGVRIVNGVVESVVGIKNDDEVVMDLLSEFCRLVGIHQRKDGGE